MGTIQTFDHTADVGLRVTAADLDDLFKTAAEGLAEFIVANRGDIEPVLTEQVNLSAGSIAELLLAWLNEIIFRTETQHAVFGRFDVRVNREACTLTATLHGEPIDRDRHTLDHEVKAATHHGLTVEQTPAGWVVEVILDI